MHHRDFVIEEVIKKAIRLTSQSSASDEKQGVERAGVNISTFLNNLKMLESSLDKQDITENDLTEKVNQFFQNPDNEFPTDLASLAEIRLELETLYKHKTGIPCTKEIKNDDQLRNINSYEYLRNFRGYLLAWQTQMAVGKRDIIMGEIAALIDRPYDATIPYGDIYTKFLHTLARQIKADNNKTYLGSSACKRVIDLIYNNSNLAIERSYEMIKPSLRDVRQTSEESESSVRGYLTQHNGWFREKVKYIFRWGYQNATTPVEQGEVFWGLIKSNIPLYEFKAQLTTSQPSIREYNYKQNTTLPLENRCGQQIQRVKKHWYQFFATTTIIDPLFSAWSEVQVRNNTENMSRIDRLYINNLPIDRPGYFFNGNRETNATSMLQQYAKEHTNIVVITLPSDKGLLDRKMLRQHSQTFKNLSVSKFKEIMLNIAKGNNKQAFDIQDFDIDSETKKILYGNDEHGILKDLIDKSFVTMGFNQETKMTFADIQAVYFHFIKFEMTDFIFLKLNPRSFNMTCKDAIDRGGVSSAYYNLMKSIQLGKPMSQGEFERALHGAPTLVKGRGMNSHTTLIWNALNTYINAKDRLGEGQDKLLVPDWLREWRNEHALPETAYGLCNQLKHYLSEIDQEIKRPSGIKSLFSISNQDKRNKERAARELLHTLNRHLSGKENTQTLPYTVDNMTYACLHNGRLGKVVTQLEKQGVLATASLSRYRKI
jgi:hypothetical protein